MQPGEVYMADFAEAGPHPVIILSRETLNRGHYALAVVCTSARFAACSELPNCVPFRAGEFGFTVDCVAQCENEDVAHRFVAWFRDRDWPGDRLPAISYDPRSLSVDRCRRARCG